LYNFGEHINVRQLVPFAKDDDGFDLEDVKAIQGSI
jgi:hypothetical protein